MRIKSILKWMLVGLGSIVALAALAVGAVYVTIERDLHRTFDVPATGVGVPTDRASIEEGRRLATLRGCNDGCHGPGGTGAVMFELPDGTRMVAPDLARTARTYSTEDLARAIRHGVRPDGTSVTRIMPSTMFHGLTDEDLGRIIAFLRHQTPAEAELPATRIGPVASLMFFRYRHILGSILAAEAIDHDAPRTEPGPVDSARHGGYLARTVCTECHGQDLHGAEDGSTPSLAIAAGYTLEEFRHLMRTGEPTGDRQLGLMAAVSRSRFVHFTDAEIDGLYAFLQEHALTSPSH